MDGDEHTMTEPTQGPRVAIWGHYHGRNLGDDVVVSAIAANLRARVPGVRLVGISLSPADTEQRHGIPAVPLRWSSSSGGSTGTTTGGVRAGLRSRLKARVEGTVVHSAIKGGRRAVRVARGLVAEPAFLWRTYRWLEDVDLILVAGSGPVSDDWKGPWSHPYTIAKWSLLARLRRIPFAFLAVGAGPIDHRLSRPLLSIPLRWAAFRSFRDDASAALVATLGVPPPLTVVPDLAMSLPRESLPDQRRRTAPTGHDSSATRQRVGLNPIPYYDKRYWPAFDDDRYAAYVAKMADYAAWVVESGRQLVLLYSQTDVDPLVCDDVMTLLARRLSAEQLGSIERPEIETVDELLGALAGCDYVVAGRFHCILLPYLLGGLAIGTAYHPKTFALMEYTGQSRYCFDIDGFEAHDLEAASVALEADPDAAREAVAKRLPGLREVLAGHYDELVATMGLTPEELATPGSRVALAGAEASTAERPT